MSFLKTSLLSVCSFGLLACLSLTAGGAPATPVQDHSLSVMNSPASPAPESQASRVVLEPMWLTQVSPGEPADGSHAETQVATGNCTVWYKFPGRRWTGVSGLSYYHAVRVRDDYIRRGADAYIE